MHISWARLASFCHSGFISDPLIVSKFHNETIDPKGQENKIYTIVILNPRFLDFHFLPFQMILFLPIFMISGTILILKFALYLIEFIFFNSSDLLEHLVMLQTSALEIKSWSRNFLNIAISVLNLCKTWSKF